MIRIEAMGHRGEGVAHMAGRAVHIPYALPGEAVEAEIAGERGRLLQVIEPSPDRMAAFCRYHGSCGGCLLQHWAPQAYGAWKRELVVRALRQRGLEAAVGALRAAHSEGRRRISLHVRRKAGRVTAGFMRVRSHEVADIDYCPILVPALAPALAIAHRIGEVAGDTDVAMTATEGGIDATLRGAAAGEAARLKLVRLAGEAGLARLSLHHEPLVERAAPLITIGRAPVRIPTVSFLQATALGEATLAELVLEAVGKAKRVADLFCGIGPFALRLAERAHILAADSDAAAVTALAQAVRSTQGLKPIKAETRDLFRDPLMPAELEGFDTVVFDPPRAGAEAQARQIARSKVKTVVSVSCDPATFARDAAILVAGGYRLETVTPVDQFAWSAHVEIVGVLGK